MLSVEGLGCCPMMCAILDETEFCPAHNVSAERVPFRVERPLAIQSCVMIRTVLSSIKESSPL